MVTLYVCPCVNDTAESLDGVAELPDILTDSSKDELTAEQLKHSQHHPLSDQHGHTVQGDPSGLSKPIFDIDVKVAF